MKPLALRRYGGDDDEVWDKFCYSAHNATLLHTRRFLSYHGERFQDLSLMIYEEEGLVGVIALAADPASQENVVSHPGATYGGLIHNGKLIGARAMEALELCRNALAADGYQTLIYKPVPHIYASVPSQDDIYALHSMSAQRVRCELSCAIDLQHRRAPSSRRRRSLKQAQKIAVLSSDMRLLPKLWSVLEENLDRRHRATPVHSLSEISLLAERFPNEVRIEVALINGQVEAGVVLFISPRVVHAQYIASSQKGFDNNALDAIFEHAISGAAAANKRYFDFGTSNEDGGRRLNAGLYKFKSEFGGGGVIHEQLMLPLRS